MTDETKPRVPVDSVSRSSVDAATYEHNALELIAAGTLPCKTCMEIHDERKQKHGDYNHLPMPMSPGRYARSVLASTKR